jgi:hypothetical protein
MRGANAVDAMGFVAALLDPPTTMIDQRSLTVPRTPGKFS